ncbi:hypothetical protein DC007_14380, partial [Enterococcus faecalis]
SAAGLTSDHNPEDEILNGRVPLDLEQMAISGFLREVKLQTTRLGRIEARAKAAAAKGQSSEVENLLENFEAVQAVIMENNKKLCDYEVITDNDYWEEDEKFYNQLVALKEEINKSLIEKKCTGLEKEYQQIRDEAAEVMKKAEAGLPDKMSPAEITKTISELECSNIE